MSDIFKSIDLFAGIGGIRLGFERAFQQNLRTVFTSEWDEYAQKLIGSILMITTRLQEI